jgi:hypothetical protein
MLAAWLLLVHAASAQETWPPGETVPDAASIHVTKAGFDSVAGLIPSFLPTEPIPVDPVSDAQGWGCVNYAYSLTDAWVGMEATGAEIVPRTDVIDVKIHLNAWVNDASDKFLLWYEIFCSDSDCPGYVDPFPLTATIPFALQVIDGPDGKPMLDAAMGDIQLENGLDNSHIQLDCSIDDVESVLNIFGLSFYDLVIGLAEDQIKSELESQKADLEATLEEALAAAHVNTDVDVNGIPLHLELYPRTVDVTDAGLALGMQGLADAPASGCVDAFDPGGSLRTDGAPQPVADDPAGSQVGILVSDDFADQALYALWRGGLLCYDLTESESVPVDLTTSLLGALGGDRMKELWPEGDEQMAVFTAPRQAPVVDYAGSHDVTVVVGDLGIEFMAPLDYRNVHALGVALDIDAGVDVTFDGATGQAAIAVDVGEGAITTRVHSNEFGADPDQVVTSFGGLVDSMVGSLLGSALEGMSFSLAPFAEGLGLQSLTLEPAGDGTWLGAWAAIGPVDYTGDGSEGCGGGCSTGSPAAALASLLALAFTRRRR